MILWKYGRRVVRDSQESDLKVAGSSPVTVSTFLIDYFLLQYI